MRNTSGRVVFPFDLELSAKMNENDFKLAADHANSYCESFLKKLRVPGLAVAVTDENGLIYANYLGDAELGRAKIAKSTRFFAASIGKTFTGLCISQLIEQNVLDPQQKVEHYIPWFEVGGKRRDITLHHLLTHTAGITRGSDFTPCSEYEIHALAFSKHAREPGSIFHYSNIGYKILGHVIERVTGKPYQKVIKEMLIDPLGMAATSACLTDADRQGMATGYESCFRDRPYCVEYPLEPAPFLHVNTGDGSLVTTPEDLCRFLRMLMNGGSIEGHTLIESETLNRYLLAPQVSQAFNISTLHYGYGMTIDAGSGAMIYGHGGEAPGFKSCYLLDRGRRLGIAVLSNGPLLTVHAAYHLLECFRNALDGKDPPPLPGYEHRFHEASRFEGWYQCADKSIELYQRGNQLMFSFAGIEEDITVRPHGSNAFFVPHPDFQRFTFEVKSLDDGIELWHGADVYVKGAIDSPIRQDIRDEGLNECAGYYVSHNPWLPGFRVVLQNGNLMLIEPNGKPYKLSVIGDGRLFSLTDHHELPEWIEFDPPVDGRVLRVSYSGCEYYRSFLEP